MGAIKLKGIVLSSFNYEEASKIVTVYSDKFGKLAFVAPGVNKLISKNKYSLLSFSKSEFEIFKSNKINGLSKLKTGSLIDLNIDISKDYDSYLYASAIVAIINNSIDLNQKNYKLFFILDNCLKLINDNNSPFLTFTLFLFYSLRFFGGGFNLNDCYRCGLKNKVYRFFDFENYGLVCPSCWKTGEPIQKYEFLIFLINLNKNNFVKSFNTANNIEYIIILSYLLLTYYNDVLGIDNLAINKIKNKKFLSQEAIKNYTHSVLTKFTF